MHISSGKSQGGDRIILLTDGEQNTKPGPTDANVIRALDNAHVFVDAISFTAAADKSMVKLDFKHFVTCILILNKDLWSCTCSSGLEL